jgi:hypothetical protein
MIGIADDCFILTVIGRPLRLAESKFSSLNPMINESPSLLSPTDRLLVNNVFSHFVNVALRLPAYQKLPPP